MVTVLHNLSTIDRKHVKLLAKKKTNLFRKYFESRRVRQKALCNSENYMRYMKLSCHEFESGGVLMDVSGSSLSLV